MTDRGIRVKAFAVLPSVDGTRHLVWRGSDPSKDGAEFHRLLGGHVERGERALDAALREITEETGSTLLEPRLLGVLENIYTFQGEPGHEVVFVYAGRLADVDVVPAQGGWLDDGGPIWAEWRPYDDAADAAVDLPLYPEGLGNLLRSTGTSRLAGGLDPAVAARLTRTADGLVPAIVQQHDSGEVLMLGWMDDAALARTLTTGRATYWSRSRQEYWVKGDTSGHEQHVVEVRLDCDGDTLLVRVDQVGAACHTGDRTCFDADVLLAHTDG